MFSSNTTHQPTNSKACTVRGVSSVFSSCLYTLCWFALSLCSVYAENYIPPHLVKITTPRYRPAEQLSNVPLGTYEYSVGWEGINAASCTVTVDKDGDSYIIESAARTYTGVDLLYKLRYSATSIISAKDFSSKSLFIEQQENTRHKQIAIEFSPDTHNIYAIRGKGPQDPNKKTVSFSPGNFTLDPVGATFLAKTVDWSIGDTKHFDVFNGKSRYLISLTAERRTTLFINGEERAVIALTPQVRNLTAIKPGSKLREATIFISDDAKREVLRIESAVFIGRVITELERFTPKTSAHPLVHMVRNLDENSMRAQLQRELAIAGN